MNAGHRRHGWGIAGLMVVGLALRLFYFTGFALGDDIFYGLQAADHALNGSWPPVQLHWQTRLGVTMPTTLSLMLFGRQPWAFVLWPLLASLATIPVCYAIAREFVPEPAALLAAAFQACFPLELIYATHLFPDVLLGLFSALSLWFWIRALRHDRVSDYVWAGVAFGAAYLCREAIIVLGPVYIALWAYEGRWLRPRMVWVAVVPLCVVAAESLLYLTTTGSADYRLQAVLIQSKDPVTLSMVLASQAGGGYFTDPLLMLVSSHEFGLYHLAMAMAVPYAWTRCPQLRPLILWWGAGFVWLYYGTTEPTRYMPLQRDPRYAAVLSIPAVTVLAAALWMLRPRLRWTVAGVILAVGVLGTGLDTGPATTSAHARFLESTYAADAGVEPADYYGMRWRLGLETPPPFSVVDDIGRATVVELLRRVGGTRVAHRADVRYVAFTPTLRPDLAELLLAEGWRQVDEIKPDVMWQRWLAGRVVAELPGDGSRAERLISPRGLVIFENPARRALTESRRP